MSRDRGYKDNGFYALSAVLGLLFCVRFGGSVCKSVFDNKSITSRDSPTVSECLFRLYRYSLGGIDF